MISLRQLALGLPGRWRLKSNMLPTATTAAAAAVRLFSVPSPQRTSDSFSPRNALVDSTNVLEADRALQVHWEDGHTSHYDFTWLRVNCPSFLHESGQRTVFPGDVGAELKPVEISTPEFMMSVTWSDGHVSVYRADWLRAHDNSPASLHERSHGTWPTTLCAWDAIPKVDGAEYMKDDRALYLALQKVNSAGGCLLENVGTEEGTVLDIAQRVAPVSHEMLYGPTFDVVSQAKPRNMAYTNDRLRLHMDLVYYESPPGLQFLHCVEFDEDISGGASTFLDAFAAADFFRAHHPDHFEVLSRVPTSFHKVRVAAPPEQGADRNLDALSPAYMEYQRPLFQVDPNGHIVTVTWAPMFEGVLMCSAQDMAPYHEAYRAFQHLIEDSTYAKEHTVRTRLEPGQCVVFNNRRLLHGRDAFSAPIEGGANRLLQGCYVNIDDAMSRLCSLHAEQTPSDDPAQNQISRPGNGCLPLVDYRLT